MESLGNKLKISRESKGYTHDQVSQETHISSRYLKALEEEEFSAFPGEPFLLGFLRNYSEFLGLDVQELLSLYRAMKIQAEPVPVDQLLKPSRPFPFKPVIAVLAGLVLLGGIGGIVYILLNRSSKPPAVTVKPHETAEYTLNSAILERRFYQGDAIIVPIGDSRYVITLVHVGDAVTVGAPDREVILDLGQDVNIDLNGDGFEELKITAADFVKNESAVGALLRFELDTTVPVLPATAAAPAPQPGTSGSGTLPPVTAPVPLPAAGLANATVIFSSPSAYPFTLQSNFQGYCMFRWEILSEQNRRERREQYYQKADELNIQAQNGIRIWVSNAATVKIQVIGGGRTVPLELGGAGEVVVAEVRWVRNDENRYQLLLVKL
ncbi:MAG: helix-turn-helix domain-containing protein [Spirochaetaceae bacterium]|jgi:cytoskeletal protein RodZ|nr:helix-turn-helix domain-containing protein [Spirochaetaceae bacterium]